MAQTVKDWQMDWQTSRLKGKHKDGRQQKQAQHGQKHAEQRQERWERVDSKQEKTADTEQQQQQHPRGPPDHFPAKKTETDGRKEPRTSREVQPVRATVPTVQSSNEVLSK